MRYSEMTMRSVIASPNFVPHEVWDRFVWLLPHEKRREPWYYAAATGEDPASRDLPSDPDFLQTVDPALRPLVSWLHWHGIATGPSCAGHDISKRGFKEIYAGLERDANQIQMDGLMLRDPEDGRDYLMQDESYELPWSSFQEFRQAAEEHQPIGWLPFYTTDPRVELALGAHSGFEIKPTGPNTYGVKTTGDNPNAWGEAFSILRQALS